MSRPGQIRLSQEIGQLKHHPTLPQSPVSDLTSSSKPTGQGDSSRTTLYSLSESGSVTPPPVIQSLSASPSTTVSGTVSSVPPISRDKPKTLTELEETPTSPQSSQSSLDENQLVRSGGQAKATMPSLVVTGCRDKAVQQESSDEQDNSQSQGLRRSTRRSVCSVPS